MLAANMATFFFIGRASRTRLGRSFSPADPVWPNWPAFFITGRNGRASSAAARPFTMAVGDRWPRPLSALAKMVPEGDVPGIMIIFSYLLVRLCMNDIIFSFF